MKNYTRIKAVVSLDAIAKNFQAMHEHLRPKTQIIAVIKADGYGHGAIPIAKLIHDYDYIWGFAVATAEEAFSLRTAGVTKPILILGLVFPEHYEELIRQDVRLTVCEEEMAIALSEEAGRQKKTVHIHIALDTGMTRIGFSDRPESLKTIGRISQLPNLKTEGLFTHFARADETDRSPAMAQWERFQKFAEQLKESGVRIPCLHCSNSAGIIRIPEGWSDLVRAGITIYGIYPSEEVEQDVIKLEPAMELKSHVSYVKDVEPGCAISYGGTFVTEKRTRVATIPAGYADGYPRQLSNKGSVLIHGKRAKILGRVCMDQFMVDVTDIPDVRPSTEVTLMGRDGEAFLGIEELGSLSGRFPYEFACEISKRVPRVYIRNKEESEDLTFF